MSELISRQDAIDAIDRAVTKEAARWSLQELPSAQPERKKGEWIYSKEQLEIVPMWECSCCRIRMPKKFNFCPNCGSYNGGGQSEAD